MAKKRMIGSNYPYKGRYWARIQVVDGKLKGNPVIFRWRYPENKGKKTELTQLMAGSIMPSGSMYIISDSFEFIPNSVVVLNLTEEIDLTKKGKNLINSVEGIENGGYSYKKSNQKEYLLEIG